MAWTSPHTYTVGELVDKARLDADVRDNLLNLSTHQHSGAAGDGNDELEGVDWITGDYWASDAAAPAASKLKIFFMNTGAVRIRENGGSGIDIADENHTHS